MTTLVRWNDFDRATVRFRVNGCLDASISEFEVRSRDDFERLALERVTPLVWLAMPCHDEPGFP